MTVGAVGRRWRTALICGVIVMLASPMIAACGGKLAEAREYEAAGDWAGALKVYEEVLGEHPESVEALSGAAVALMILQRYDEALTYQELVVAADPTDAQIRLELGFNYLGHQDRPLDAARVMGEAATIDPSAKNLTFWAQALEASGDLKGAEDALRKAIAVDAEYQYARSELVELLEAQGRMDEAAEVLEDAEAGSASAEQGSEK
jgi:tetratricopeptide (TPR) repeat protein